MAVSLNDAWNDLNFIQNDSETSHNSMSLPTMDTSNGNTHMSISAKQSKTPLSETESQIPPPVAKPEKDYTLHLEAILMEFQTLRKEQAKRFTVFIVILSILFAALLMYVNTLQCKIKDMSTNVRRIQWINRNRGNLHEQLSPFSDTFPWLQ
mgnify:CR=1 FL=1